MAIVKYKKEIEVEGFRNFCEAFGITTKLVAGPNGSDEELILEELEKIKNENWLLNFIDDGRDGYFRLQLLK